MGVLHTSRWFGTSSITARALIKEVIDSLDSNYKNWTYDSEKHQLVCKNIHINLNDVMGMDMRYNRLLWMKRKDKRQGPFFIAVMDIGVSYRVKLKVAVSKVLHKQNMDEVFSFTPEATGKEDQAIMELLKETPNIAPKYVNHPVIGKWAKKVLEEGS